MPNLVYVNQDTAITWRASGGDNDLTLTSLAAGAGRNGELYDLTADARARRYAWRAWVKFATTPVVQEHVDVYLRTSDGTHPDNDDGTGDIALSAEDKLRNLHFLGSIIVDEASTSPEFVASGTVEIDHRHCGPTFFNDTADALSATAAEHGFDLIPMPDEVQ